MSTLNPTSTVIARALAGLVAAGCASQSTSDNESADNAAAGQSDVVSQTNPLDQPAPGTAEAAVQPSASGQQYSESSQTASSGQWNQPATDQSAQSTESTQSASTNSSTDMASSTYDSNANAASTMPSTTTSSSTSSADSTAYDAERQLPPRADRN